MKIQNIFEQFGGTVIKLKTKTDYQALKNRILFRGLLLSASVFVIVFLIYRLIWWQTGGNVVVRLISILFDTPEDDAFMLYQHIFRGNEVMIWIGVSLVVFIILFRFFITSLTRYLDGVSKGIDQLLQDKEISLMPEMSDIEKKLNTVHRALEKRAIAAKLAEQRKNDLVLYLAHDIRTPLTSVIGYLSLLDELPEMPSTQRQHYIHLTLEKSKNLDQLTSEFFEITRYNLEHINLEKRPLNLDYMLIQMADEFYPLLQEKSNTITLDIPSALTIMADGDKLARVFNNLLKNAVAYSYPKTAIHISAHQKDKFVEITFCNCGPTIEKEQLDHIFEKFYRLDSSSGGSGLGLAISKKIVEAHGGSIETTSNESATIFTVYLPMH